MKTLWLYYTGDCSWWLPSYNLRGWSFRNLHGQKIEWSRNTVLHFYLKFIILRSLFRYTILEKAPALGGTWWENIYPGAACDVPSHLYSYSFFQNPNWSRAYSHQREILRYLQDAASRWINLKKMHWKKIFCIIGLGYTLISNLDKELNRTHGTKKQTSGQLKQRMASNMLVML